MRFRRDGFCSDSLYGLLCALLATSGGCVSKSIHLRAVDGVTGAPVADAAVHQHGARWFAFFPETEPAVTTDAQGEAAVVLNARGTNLVLLRPGYVPTQLAIVPQSSAPRGGTPTTDLINVSPSNYVEFERLASNALVEIELTPTVARTVRVCVRSESALPLQGVEVIAHTGLFLPKDGTEAQWGLPPIQIVATSADGYAEVTVYGGLRNYLYARSVGRDCERISLDEFAANTQVDLTLPNVEFKSAVIRLVDAATGTPIANATVQCGKMFDGVARDPNGWSVRTDASGCTPTVRLPDAHNLSVTASRKGYRSSRKLIAWRLIREGHPIEISIDRE